MWPMLNHQINRHLPVYLVQLIPTLSATGRISWQDWRPIVARDFHTAAIGALRRGDFPDWKQCSKMVAYVARDDGPKHDHGGPICVHRLDLELSPAEGTEGSAGR